MISIGSVSSEAATRSTAIMRSSSGCAVMSQAIAASRAAPVARIDRINKSFTKPLERFGVSFMVSLTFSCWGFNACRCPTKNLAGVSVYTIQPLILGLTKIYINIW